MRVDRFRDRFEAGSRLVAVLPADLPVDTLVIGLARGGVQTAAAVARARGSRLDALAVRKVGHPLQPEYALGAVAPGGNGVYIRSSDGITQDELAAVVVRAKQAADELDRRLHARHAKARLTGRTVLLVDDGLATGATMTAAVRWAHAQGAARVAVGVPVAAASSAARLRDEAEVWSVIETEGLGAVGFWYERFDPVGEEEVLELLDELGTPAPPQ
jgi:putative phosphoribosyl transferase